METVQVPPGALPGTSETLFQASETAHHMLVARPDQLMDQPANAAYALMLYEIATVEASGRLSDQWPGRLMREARPVVRAAAGLASEATAQQMVDALWAASQALRRNDEPGARMALVPPAALQTEIARDRLQRYTLPSQGVRALRELQNTLMRDRLSNQ